MRPFLSKAEIERVQLSAADKLGDVLREIQLATECATVLECGRELRRVREGQDYYLHNGDPIMDLIREWESERP